MFGSKARIGLVVPANNATIEPELWSVMPVGTAVFATRILAKGDLTPDAVVAMEHHFDRAVDELCATGVDVIVYADMVTTFIMDPDWNAHRTAEVTRRTGVPCFSAWMAMQAGLEALGVRRFALGTPYPRPVHALCAPFFARLGYAVTSEDTLDILGMTDVPNVSGDTLTAFAGELRVADADAIVLLATDLPTFSEIRRIEQASNRPVLTSNQTILWHALRRSGAGEAIPSLGRLFES